MAKNRVASGNYWDKNWGIVGGCTPAGAGCVNCWAKANHERWGSQKHPPDIFSRPFSEVRVFPNCLDEPLRRQTPTRYAPFTSDLFHKNVPDDFLDQAFAVMALCPQHTFIVLTKRWERMAEYLSEKDLDQRWLLESLSEFVGRGQPWAGQGRTAWMKDRAHVWPLPNVWLGVSVSTQAELDAAMPYVLQIPAAMRVLSLEPLLGPVDLDPGNHHTDCVFTRDEEARQQGRCNCDGGCDNDEPGERWLENLDWVIVGCESGPNRRPCEWTWVRDIVEQCRAASVPVFVKQVAKASGPVLKDPAAWPESIRVRELPG